MIEDADVSIIVIACPKIAVIEMPWTRAKIEVFKM
jgi:hypothetical protein